MLRNSPVSPEALAGWAVVIVVLVAAAARLSRRDAGWFHPLALPLVALAVMSLAAPLCVYLARQPVGLLYDPGHPPGFPSPLAVPLSLMACEALVLVLVGYISGVVATCALVTPVVPRDLSMPAFRPEVRRAGLVLLAAGACAELVVAYLSRGTSYGADQFSYGTPALLQHAAATALLAGLITVTLTEGKPRRLREVLRGREWALLAAYLLAVALTGARGGLIPPLVFLAWVYAIRIRSITLRQVTVIFAVALVVGAVIVGYRSGDGQFPTSPAVVAARAISAVSSSAWLTQQTVADVPSEYTYTRGSTYVAAVEGQLPGPLARRFGATGRTASSVFRDIIGFTDPGQGFAESLPSEAYLNFGLAGCLWAGLLFGLLMGWASRKARAYPLRPRDLLYPVLLAGLIAGFRSDALAQVKEVLYPLLVIAPLMAWYRLPGGATTRVLPLAPSPLEPVLLSGPLGN